MEGTRHGPQAILDASSQIELYDEELDCSPIDVGVYTRPALDYRGLDHATALKVSGDAVREVLLRKQIPLTLGGEHSLSAPLIATVHEQYPDLTVVHIDAHGDLRNEYEGTTLSHASIERRVVDMGIPLLEIGIRSFSAEEAEFMKTKVMRLRDQYGKLLHGNLPSRRQPQPAAWSPAKDPSTNTLKRPNYPKKQLQHKAISISVSSQGG